jgi:microcystin-dependent protein
VPPGTILPWWGDLSSIPVGFAYCDGSNGTPDLRGRTLIGTGSWSDSLGNVTYNLGTIGGERLHQLTIAEMPKHNHIHSKMDDFYTRTIDGWWRYDTWNSDGGSGRKYNIHAETDYAGGDQPHNIMQPYIAVHHIMKL